MLKLRLDMPPGSCSRQSAPTVGLLDRRALFGDDLHRGRLWTFAADLYDVSDDRSHGQTVEIAVQDAVLVKIYFFLRIELPEKAISFPWKELVHDRGHLGIGMSLDDPMLLFGKLLQAPSGSVESVFQDHLQRIVHVPFARLASHDQLVSRRDRHVDSDAVRITDVLMSLGSLDNDPAACQVAALSLQLGHLLSNDSFHFVSISDALEA
jgi:hypothetical protein